jgi:hypothetical protein
MAATRVLTAKTSAIHAFRRFVDLVVWSNTLSSLSRNEQVHYRTMVY